MFIPHSYQITYYLVCEETSQLLRECQPVDRNITTGGMLAYLSGSQGQGEAATSNVCSNAQEENVTIHKASFIKTEITIQAPVKDLWPTYLNGLKSFLPRMTKEGMSGNQSDWFWPLLRRKYCKVERSVKKTTVSELFIFEKHIRKFINIFRKYLCMYMMNTQHSHDICSVYLYKTCIHMYNVRYKYIFA